MVTDGQRDRQSTVTLTAHARRGLISDHYTAKIHKATYMTPSLFQRYRDGVM